MTPTKFVKSLSELRFKDTFNPYASRCSLYDRQDAPHQRSRTLELILQAAVEAEVDSIWIGRDLGYRGGRRTGLALTDDVHISDHAKRWGVVASRPTKGDAIAERTAAVIWGALTRIQSRIFLWNVFPLHPHEPGAPFSNRSHNSNERDIGEQVLEQLLTLLKPRQLVAIGGDAGDTACKLGGKLEVVQVRHPSYGGQSKFLRQIATCYAL